MVDSEDSDAEDLIIRQDDACFVIGMTEEDHSVLELHIYDEEQGSMYGEAQ